jgi:hypothetical protein
LEEEGDERHGDLCQFGGLTEPFNERAVYNKRICWREKEESGDVFRCDFCFCIVCRYVLFVCVAICLFRL